MNINLEKIDFSRLYNYYEMYNVHNSRIIELEARKSVKF